MDEIEELETYLLKILDEALAHGYGRNERQQGRIDGILECISIIEAREYIRTVS